MGLNLEPFFFKYRASKRGGRRRFFGPCTFELIYHEQLLGFVHTNIALRCGADIAETLRFSSLIERM